MLTPIQPNNQTYIHSYIHGNRQTGRQFAICTDTYIAHTEMQPVSRTQSQQCRHAEAQAAYTHRHTSIHRDRHAYMHKCRNTEREAIMHIHNITHTRIQRHSTGRQEHWQAKGEHTYRGHAIQSESDTLAEQNA